MAEPEQIYEEVLQEEQKKGASPVVAEARAKAARARAEHGSPHPKEARWWPEAQPHLDDGGAARETPAAEPAAASAEAEASAAEAPAAEAPAAEAPAGAAPAAQAAPSEAPVEAAPRPSAEAPPQPAAHAPAEPATPATQPAADAPAQPTAGAAPPSAPAQQPAAPAPQARPQRPSGVSHGSTTGTRLRPEDEVTTEAQFQGEVAMHERRRLLDELVASGVPAASVGEDRRPRASSLLMALLYIAIPLVAIFILAGQAEEGGGGGGAAEEPANAGGGGITVVAQSVQFNTKKIDLPANKPATITFDNQDSVEHNIAIYQNEQANKELFKGKIIPGGEQTEYKVPGLPKGNYVFLCDVHPSMKGEVAVQ